MAGGTWTEKNKVRPGVYVNFASEGQPLSLLGQRGIATLALTLPWGDSKKVLKINAGDDVFEVLGYDISDSQLILIKEALKRAKTVLLYRLNTGTKATATVGSLTATAKYGGARGNDIKIVIQQNIDDNTKFDVTTLVSDVAVDKQFMVANIAGLVNNNWVAFIGTGSLTATAGQQLTGGDNGTVTNQDHVDYLAAVELCDFQTIGLSSVDADLKALYAAFVKRLRDAEGKKIQAVLENYPAADYEGIISVKNGVILSDGTTLTAAQAIAWVAGATAGAEVNESLTYAAYDGAVDVSPRYTNAQIEAALRAGEFLFTASNGKAIVEQDINTLTIFTPVKGKMFSKNRVIRVLDGINNDFKRIFEAYYIGKVNNDADGRNLLKNECNTYMNSLQGIGAIQNYDSQNDVTVQAVDGDSVYVEVYSQPTDSIEKIYCLVKVR